MANEEYREILETKRLEIVKGINCERSLLLNYLRAKLVFDQEDCELIRAANTNDARVGKLIDFLLTKGPEAYQCFVDVVQIESPTLYESLTGEKASSSKSLSLSLSLCLHGVIVNIVWLYRPRPSIGHLHHTSNSTNLSIYSSLFGVSVWNTLAHCARLTPAYSTYTLTIYSWCCCFGYFWRFCGGILVFNPLDNTSELNCEIPCRREISRRI